MGAQRALGRGRRPASEIAAMLDELLDGVARRLRSARVVGHTVVLRLRFDDFTRITRSSTLALPTADTEPLRRALRHLLADARPTIDARGLTLVGIAVTNLTDADAVQLRLPFDGGAGIAIDHALDVVRDRFGGASIGRAALLGRARGWTMPVLPYGEPGSGS
jgi:DNA polymerase-4